LKPFVNTKVRMAPGTKLLVQTR